MDQNSQTAHGQGNANSRLTAEQRNRVEVLAEEYADRKRAGESVSVEQYVEQNPELANEIRDLFPMMEVLDRAVRDPGAHNNHLDGEIGPGTQLGEYRLIKPIGRGGMGVVYQAEHVVLGSSVAIKLLPVGLDRPKLRERFQREASAAARMRHPNIVRVFDFGVHNETLYYVMELVEGCGLNRIIDPSQPIHHGMTERNPTGSNGQADAVVPKTVPDLAPTEVFVAGNGATDFKDETEFELETHAFDSNVERSKYSTSSSSHDSLWNWVARIGTQASDALDYAHSMGVIHRDIKPANMMIDADEQIHVMDFGLAKVADNNSLTATGDVMGTLRYMPPEAFAGRADHRSDIYSLGLTLYELLANKPAFEDVDRGRLIPAITNGQITRLRKRIPKIPRDLATVVQKAIATDPTDRYQSSAELRDDLKRFLTGQPVLARRTSWIYKSTRWIGRNKVVSALAASVFALLAAAAIISSISASRFENLALEKESQRVAAISAESAAVLKTRESQLNLLAAKLSDARGWSTSRRAGHRVEGMKALREGIELARTLDVFAEHEAGIRATAVTFSALHDVPATASWKHPVLMANYAPMAFNGDLSEYAQYDYRETPHVCKIFRPAGDELQLIETIPVEGAVNLNSLKFSHDGRYLTSLIWIDNKTWLWIYDRETKRAFRHDREAQTYTPPVILNEKQHVVFLDVLNRLIVVDVNSGRTVSEWKLRDSEKWDAFSISADETKAAVFRDYGNNILFVNLSDGATRQIDPGDEEIRQVAWRPDSQQLAIAGKRIRIWDLSRRSICTRMPDADMVITELAYNFDGRLLLASGWDHTTRVYDALAERQVIRCEEFLKGVSADGRKMVTSKGQRFSIRSIISSNVLREFDFSESARSPYVGIDAQSGTLWVGAEYKTSVIDFAGNRFLYSHFTDLEKNFVAVDPQGRDAFVSFDHQLKRFPIRANFAENDSAPGELGLVPTPVVSKIQIGPPTDLGWKAAKNFNPLDIALDRTGNKLAINREKNCQLVFHRETNEWKLASHTHAIREPIRVVPHPTLPLIATCVHHGDILEVRDTDDNEVVFSLNVKQLHSDFTPDGKLLVIADEGSLQTFEVGTWRPVAKTNNEVLLTSRWFAISPESRWIAIESQEPRGVTILDSKSLLPVLLLNGNHTRPESFVGGFDASGRFLTANRGKSVIGVWDLYKLRQHFESLDLEWPLDGLGNPTPLRDPNVPVRIFWESKTRDAKQALYSLWLNANKERQSITNEARFRLDRFYFSLRRTVRSNRLQPPEVRKRICTAISQGAGVFDAGDHQQCFEIYLKLLNSIRAVGIEGANSDHMQLVSDGIEKAQRTDRYFDRAWALRRCLDELAAKLKAQQKASSN